MAPKLVVTYFDIGGAAEPIRWALELANVEWEDKRLSREEFAALKPSECMCFSLDLAIIRLLPSCLAIRLDCELAVCCAWSTKFGSPLFDAR